MEGPADLSAERTLIGSTGCGDAVKTVSAEAKAPDARVELALEKSHDKGATPTEEEDDSDTGTFIGIGVVALALATTATS